MELITKAVIIHSLDDIDVFSMKVSELNYLLIKKRLQFEYEKAVSILKEFKRLDAIKSTSKPKNKMLQVKLDALVEAKLIINKSIKQINDLYIM